MKLEFASPVLNAGILGVLHFTLCTPSPKSAQREAAELWKPEPWLTLQQGTCSASHLKCSWLESLKLLPRVGKTDGQTETLTFADLVFHHLAREKLAAV